MKNKFKMIAALIIAVAIAATGTFAWQRVIEKQNEFMGHKRDVTVHDDFDPDAGQKDVYVENRGNTTVYVRIKLDETMNLTSDTWRPGPNDWVTHTYGANAADCGHTNKADNKYFHDYFKWTMGGWKYYMPGSSSLSVVQDANKYNGTEAGVQKTPDAQIITSAQFLAMSETGQKAFIGWIYSTDGYVYWSQPLHKGEVTGLLLHGVEPLPILEDLDYYYAINVIVEIVDRKDIPMWTQGASSADGSGTTHQQAAQDGKEVINIIVGNDVVTEKPSLTLTNIPDTVKVGAAVNPPTVTVGPAGSPNSPLIWKSGNTGAAQIGADGKITGVAEGTAVISVTAPNGLTAEFVINVVSDTIPEEDTDDTELPVNKPNDGFTPITDRNPDIGDSYFAKINFLEYGNPDPNFNALYHTGSIHLEDIITDGNYSNVTVEALETKYAPYVTIGTCSRHENKPSIIFTYEPTNDEFIQMQINDGINGSKIPVQVKLTRDDGKTAVITVNFVYNGSLVTMDTSHLNLTEEQMSRIITTEELN